MTRSVKDVCRLIVALSLLIAGGSFELAAAQAAGGAKRAFFNETIVWEQREDELSQHFVYALTATPKGTLLAFAEGRIEPEDYAPHHLLLKRSTDRGATWSDDIFIERSDGAWWRANGQEGRRESWANPAVVVDRRVGRIFIFYALNEGVKDQNWTRVFYRTSDDDGQTWQPRVEVTTLFKENTHGWTFHMPGPGHGIQLMHQRERRKNGRLVLPVWNRRAVSAADRNYGVTVIYSDDGGKTWKRGVVVGMEYGMNESRIVELADGRLLVNGRGSAAEHNDMRLATEAARLYAKSRDAGESFSPTIARTDLPFLQTDSSMIRYPFAKKNILLFSHPASRTERARMTVSVSFDEGRSWAHHKLISEHGATYSDLAVLPDKTIGLLYGADRTNNAGQKRWAPRQVVFARFNYEWLMTQRNRP